VVNIASEKDREKYNNFARHPLQSWEWGDFRKNTGVDVERFIETQDSKVISVYQITWHRIPKTKYCVGYCPKSDVPSREAIEKITESAKNRGAIFVKFEPNVRKNDPQRNTVKSLQKDYTWVSGKPLFTKYTFWLDISPDEETLLKNMNQKTRYNLRLAQKKGVVVVEDNSEVGFESYWNLMEETTKRQGFFAHGKSYHQKMWQAMIRSGSGHLMKAVFEGKVLTTWVLFELNKILYYPYGASSNERRDVMASNLMMWEAIRLGKQRGCVLFDLWGSLGPEPDTKDPWYGFHKFKQGYGPELVEFLGSYDLVINRKLYKAYNFVDKIRWVGLKLLARIRK